MKFLPLLLANLRRKRIRTALTAGSFMAAFFLFGILAGVSAGFSDDINLSDAYRLIVIGRTGLMQPLPLAYHERLKRVPGVSHAAYATWFGGVYQDPKNFFAQFAVEPEDWRAMYPEFAVDEAQWQEFVADRQGVAIGRKLAERFGWKLGDRIPLKAPSYLGGGSWDFNVRAIIRGTRPHDDEGQFWMQARYLHEKAPPYWRGIVGWYTVRIDKPDQAIAVSKAIDDEFANSASETRTQTESAFAASFVKQMGNVRFLMLAIGSVVFFTLLLVTGNTMAIAVRERTGELAVLKAVGFSDLFVLGLVLAESLLIAVVGGGLGLWLARGIVSQDITRGLILVFLSPSAIATGVALILATGVLAGLLPAIGAMRLSVVDALRRV